jgi:probable F420-dependent oxidoreductase
MDPRTSKPLVGLLGDVDGRVVPVAPQPLFGSRGRGGTLRRVTRPFRFGVVPRAPRSGSEWRATAQRAEELAYSTLLVPDHLTAPLSPWTALSWAASATDRLRVGTHVLNNDLRHPVLVAREAATLDRLSGGRFELGLGAGHMRIEYEQAGLEYEPGAVRVERLSESVKVIKALLSGGDVTFEGRHYTVRGHRLRPEPEGQARLPILVGGNGDRLLAMAAREADIVAFTGFSHRRGGAEVELSAFTAEGLDRKVRLVREFAGNRFADLELSALVQRVVVTGDRRVAADQEAKESRGSITTDQALKSPFLLFGTEREIAEELVHRRQRFGISYFTVFESAMESLAPVIRKLAGR